MLPSTISKEAFLIQLSNGTTVTPPCVGISPNLEFNERQCVVTFGEFGNRIPSAQEGSLYVTGVSIAQGEAEPQAGRPRGDASALPPVPPGCAPRQRGTGTTMQQLSPGQVSHRWRATAWPVARLHIARAGSGLKLVGPDGPVSAEGLSFTNPTGERWRCQATSK